jgi:cell division protein FtsI/penicillin-binding protein 2
MVLCLLVGRLIQLQLISTEHFTDREINLLEASVRQRSQEMVIDTGRGNFLDRSGRPLTHKNIPVLILFPFLAKMDWDIERVSEITGASEYSLRYSVENAKEPFAFGKPEPLQLTEEQMEKINALKIPGVFAVEKKYNLLESPAAQLIGITGENQNLVKERYPDKELSINTMVGITGMEKSFDEFLLPEGASKLVYHVDATGGPLFGINVKYVEPANPFYPVNIKTTLDYDLQMMAENLADRHGIKKGGIVLLDIETNTVLAMVSRPSVNKDNPFDKESGGAVNQMIKQQIMGSVFKTVVAAAAIDHGLDDPARQFDCSKKINGQPDPKYQHGMLNFNDSFARSCNNTFATVAKELKDIDSEVLEDYAKKLSLTGPVSWQGDIYHFNDFRQLQDEEKGRVFLSEDAKKDRNFVALTGIGQHEVRATPLAVSNMIATIARGGQKDMVRVASEIEYKNSTSLLEFKEKKLDGETIAPYTAMKLQKLLREVVINEDGTGKWFKKLPYEVAGKSGTAETGRIVAGKQLHNKWFAGYFPYKNPKYALVTVNLGVTEDTGGVNPLFADLVKGIYNFNHKEEVPPFGSTDS